MNTLETYKGYSLIEEKPNVKSWDKETISYLINNENKVREIIRKTATSKYGRELADADIDDIFDESLLYFYSCDDYNLDKAIKRSSTDKVVSLDGYICSCLKYCVLRYITSLWDNEKYCVHEEIDTENDTVSLYDTASLEKSEENIGEIDNIGVDLEQICKQYESERYLYGADIFFIWYVKLLIMQYNVTEKHSDIVMQAAGVTKQQIEKVKNIDKENNPMMDIAKAVTIIGVGKSLEIIEKYTYGAKKIKDVILNNSI